VKKQFEDKKVIVTGGAGGIGGVVAGGFLSEGAQVLVLDINKKELKAKCKELRKISPRISGLAVDVSDKKQVKKTAIFIKNKFAGRIDVLVNAAGIYGPIGKFEEADLDFWRKTIEVNLVGTVNMCALVIPFMKKVRRGKIINFSGGGDGPSPRFTAYGSSKAAVLRFTESVADELSKYNIYVNAVSPGPVNTRFLDERLRAGIHKVGKDFYLASKKQKREGGVSPTKVRDLILFLSSEKPKTLTGKMISAIHDDWENIPKHLNILNKTDIYNTRRIKPADRNYDW